MSAGKVLVILPCSRFLKLNNTHSCMVGYHLKELAVPMKALRQNDYQIVIATPNGETPFIDPNSLCDVNEDERLFYEHLVKENIQMLLPLSLEKMTEEFLGTVDGVLIPGGFATLVDFWQQPAIKHILKHMHRHCKPTAAIGHGTVALAYEVCEGESWAYAHYQMTCPKDAAGVNSEARQLMEPLDQHVQNILEQAGAEVIFDPSCAKGFALEHQELITGQDAAASKKVAQLLLAKLSKYQHCRCC